MKNKVVLIMVFVLLFSAFVPYPVNANAAPPPIVTIAVINPPSDLKLSVRYTKDSVTETKLLERWDAGWEANFRLMDYYFWRDYKLYSNGVLIVKSKDYNFELPLPDEIFINSICFIRFDSNLKLLLKENLPGKHLFQSACR